MTRIIGIDPGSQITGYGIIDIMGNKTTYVDSGCIRTPSGQPLANRLRSIFEAISQIISQYRPDEMAVEQVFMHRNPDSALKLGQARGVAICAGAVQDLPVSEYAPRAIKQAVVGSGGAVKEQVQHMVCALLDLPQRPQSDAADALAVALCHVHTLQTLSRLGHHAMSGDVAAMIGRLRGILADKRAPYLMIEVQGVGYDLEASLSTFEKLPELGAEVTLFTHLAVREDAHNLYGFFNISERALFRDLIKVSGIGAKLALLILSGMSVEAFSRCVREGDSAALIRLPGIGKKTAERLMIEMRDRIGALDLGSGPEISGVRGMAPVASNPREDAISALVSLGYKLTDASRMVNAVYSEDLASDEIIRRALQASVRQ